MSEDRHWFQRDRTIALRLIPLALMVLALGGCGTSSSSATATAPRAGPAGTIHVVMKNIAFNPGTIYAKVGQTVTWTNEDDAPHNVTYASGPRFTSSPTFTQGESWTLKLTKPGVIRYVCTIHPGMHGAIIVTR
ncbi:MAG: plastocyanin/azurin family copper-binding protein [Solirubrobacteraceae bacterium]